MINNQQEGNSNNYKVIVKATSLFGGVESFKIIIKIIRSKFVAVLLGPVGIGINGLLASTIEIISVFTSFGLRASAVRNIAEANGTGDIKKISLVISVMKKLVWYTGFLGMLVCLIFSSYWSKIAFGNSDFTSAFIILSISLLIVQLTHGQNAVLQGLQKYKYLAKMNVFGQIVGLFVGVPLYYLWGIKAIVPVLLLSYTATFAMATYFYRKVKIKKSGYTKKDMKSIGGDMLKMGIVLSLQSILALASSYAVRIYVSNKGGVADVGLYQSGFGLVHTSVGLVFSAMATDYYPRLTKIASDKRQFQKAISQQTEIGLLLIAPIVIAFIIFIKWIIVLLYSSKFLPIENMMYWIVSAMFFKLLAWSISYGILAKGDIKVFFWSEFSVNIYGLGLNILGYNLFGFMGLGISFLVLNIIYFLQLLVIAKKRYDFTFDSVVFKSFLLFSAFVVISLSIKLFLSNEIIRYLSGTLLLTLTLLYSYNELEKRIGIKQLIMGRFSKK